MRTFEHPGVAARRKRAEPVVAPAWQAVGLPGSEGWPARMARRGPDGRADVMCELQHQAGNRNLTRSLARYSLSDFFDTARDVGAALIDEAMCFTLSASVGRGGENRPEDVRRVRARLQSLGYPSGGDPESLAAAIEGYQAAVVKLRRPDGRIDPGGRTLAKLNEGASATPAESAPAPAEAAPAAETPLEVTPAAPAPVPATPVAAPATGALAEVREELARVRALADRTAKRARELDREAAKAVAAARNAKDDAAKATAESKRTHGQEVGQERDELVAAIKALRMKIDALTPESTGLSAQELKAARAGLWREVARLAPFYYQMVNTNVLFDEKLDKKTKKQVQDTAAGGRTCNVTSLSMTLEALGKSAADYKGADAALIPYVHAHFKGTLDSTALDRVTQDPAGLRLPDFLELLAVVKMLPEGTTAEMAEKQPAQFAEAVEAGRDRAVNQILQSGWFDKLVGGFGVEVDNEYPFGGMKVGEVKVADVIERVGQINRSNLPAALKKEAKARKLSVDKLTAEDRAAVAANVAKYYDEDLLAKGADKRDKKLAEAEAALAKQKEKLTGATGKSKRKIEQAIARYERQIYGLRLDERLAAAGVNRAAANARELDRILPIAKYIEVVGGALSAHLDQGHQVVGHMHNHFFRVEAVEEDGVRVDDPGRWDRNTYLMTWDECRALGSFSRFTWVKPR